MAAMNINQQITATGQKDHIKEAANIPHFYDDSKIDTVTPREFLKKV